VAFWLELAPRRAGPMLELACGTGRVTLPLAASRDWVVGLDHDPAMLAELARRRRGRWPLLVAADMRDFALTMRFGAIFVAYNSIQLLPEWSDMVACLTCARRHLVPGGVVGLEVTDFQESAADGPVGAELLGQAEGVQLLGSLVHDLAGRTSRYRRRFTGPGWMVEDEVALRSLDRPELAALFDASGLNPTRWWNQGATLRAVARP
jgi:SAM-dependent methyltransferase